MWVINLFGWILVLAGVAGIVMEYFFYKQYQSFVIHGFGFLVAGIVVLAIHKIIGVLADMKELFKQISGKD
ncbi:hypothetical protein N9I17_05830 [Amylibacter sp.]|mgnify:FL=1|nr:hypothetical protein [Amylibacter sp.]